MATSFCPRCAAPRAGTLRYCASCAYDFWGAAAGQVEPTPTPPPPAAADTAPDWVQQRHAATPPPVRRDSPAKVGLLVAALSVIGIFWYIGQANEASTPDATATPRPTATPQANAWPDDYELWVCGAVQELQMNAGPAMTDMGNAANVLDVDGVIEAADRASQSGADAQGMLELIPSWAPGDAVVSTLLSVVTSLQRAVNLLKLGATTLDEETINAGNAELTAANDLIGEAGDALADLRLQYDFAC
jgi:hypothetical protein